MSLYGDCELVQSSKQLSEFECVYVCMYVCTCERMFACLNVCTCKSDGLQKFQPTLDHRFCFQGSI